jgi:probable HAF family extracellular repeat protein
VKSKRLTCIKAMTLLAGLAIPVHHAAQEQEKEHSRYKLIDLGTLGGPSAYKSVNAPGYQILSNSGLISASADTSAPDPNAPNLCFNPDCFLTHAFRWKNGVLTDLGALPGMNSSAAGAINARGWSAGQSQNGEIDPVSGLPESRSVLWKDDQIPIDLGTFGGNWSLANTLNNLGQVVGFATNAIPDPFPIFPPGGTQSRAFLWQNGVLKDLGTLGGPDALAFSINQRGQVAGISYTDPNETLNPTTGMPTFHPFLWDHGTMTDLGTLGGTMGGEFLLGFESALLVNNRGQVMGTSSLAGDRVIHPFLWTHGVMRDLGTLGGDNGAAVWLTDNGEVVGDADLPNSPPGCQSTSCVHHAFLWKDGVITDLGTLGSDQCSRALMMNSRGQIVGTTIAVCGFESTHPFLWENGGPMVDLNTLVPENSGATLYEADNINERGEIVASGLPAGCDNRFACGHIYLLIPCGVDNEGCGDNTADTASVTQSNPAPVTSATQALTTATETRLMPSERVASFRALSARRYHIPGVVTRPAD